MRPNEISLLRGNSLLYFMLFIFLFYYILIQFGFDLFYCSVPFGSGSEDGIILSPPCIYLRHFRLTVFNP